MEASVTREQEVIKRARDEIEKRAGKTPEQLYEEREKRLTDIVNLKVPDRMPVFMRGAYFPIKYAGLSPSAVFYDPVAYKEAIIKTFLDFDPDIITDVGDGISGLGLEKLGTKQYLWPGGPLPRDQHPQFQEMEIMKENEYDLFITDPTDFMIRYYMPRIFGALEPFSKLPPLGARISVPGTGAGLPPISPIFADPGVRKAAEALYQAGQEQKRFSHWYRGIGRALGIPALRGGPGTSGIITPFDTITDNLRGMRGIMIDMFMRPEKLFTAMERILEWNQARAVPFDPKERGNRRVTAGGAHWGSEEFLTKKQFETFYWPTWKKSMLAAIDRGFVPVPHPEGKYDDRIECFLELPKGKAFLYTELLDVIRAKEILAGHIGFMGGVPASLLWSGSPQEVEEHCKNVIKICGKGGGFILSCAGGEDDAKPENVKAMVNAIKKYGRY